MYRDIIWSLYLFAFYILNCNLIPLNLRSFLHVFFHFLFFFLWEVDDCKLYVKQNSCLFTVIFHILLGFTQKCKCICC